MLMPRKTLLAQDQQQQLEQLRARQLVQKLQLELRLLRVPLREQLELLPSQVQQVLACSPLRRRSAIRNIRTRHPLHSLVFRINQHLPI